MESKSGRRLRLRLGVILADLPTPTCKIAAASANTPQLD